MTRRFGTGEVSALLILLENRLDSRPRRPARGCRLATHPTAQLDPLGYEALVIQRDGQREIEAFNCVFHTLATQ